MKVSLSYEEMTRLIDEVIPKIEAEGFDEIIGVVRGGLTASHYIAKKLRLPVGVYYPSSEDITYPRLYLSKPHKSRKILFVEDLVAKGRTFTELSSYMKDRGFEWSFMPVLVDGDFPLPFEYQAMKTKDWIVFPYEEYDKMSEGDRGLFRNKTDSYGVNHG